MNAGKAGKSALIAAGAGLGLLKSLRVLANIGQSAARIDKLGARVDTLNVAIARLAEQTEGLQDTLSQRVTKSEFTEKMDRLLTQIDHGIDERFERHVRSVEALRLMVRQTDELLQRVLDGLEGLRSAGSSRRDEASMHWEFTEAEAKFTEAESKGGADEVACAPR